MHAGDAVIAPSTTRRLLEHVAADLPTTSSEDEALTELTERDRVHIVIRAHESGLVRRRSGERPGR